MSFLRREEKNEQDISATEWLNEILKEAIRMNASDIHIVPTSDRIVTFFRIDGVVQKVDEWDKQNHETVVSRIKVISGLKVVERHVPQDGHLEILLSWPKQEAGKPAPAPQAEVIPTDFESPASVEEAPEPTQPAKPHPKHLLANFRVSVMPTIHGESAVLRALNRQDSLMPVSELGFSGNALPVVQGVLRKSHGMIVVAGPTGSGKTTTLYSLLNSTRDNGEEKTILTLEDPVEYSLPGVRQTQIRPEVGITFGAGLKAILRQDPDVVMIGEIRDEETAEIAVRASLTGRLVFSTFHTNDLAGVVTRLIDMDIGRSLIASALSGMISQRLVRKICPHCRQEVEPPMDLLALLGITEWKYGPMYAGAGCEQCGGIGYKGRIGIFEVVAMDDELRSFIIQKASADTIGDMIQKKMVETMVQDGLGKIQQGVTTVEEVVKVVV